MGHTAKQTTPRSGGFKFSLVLGLTALMAAQIFPQAPAFSAEPDKPAPTMLIPIAPKIDASGHSDKEDSALNKFVSGQNSKWSHRGSLLPLEEEIDQKIEETDKGDLLDIPDTKLKVGNKSVDIEHRNPRLKSAPASINAEKGNLEEDWPDFEIGEDTTLKGTIQLVADDTEYDEATNTFLGTGHAVVTIGGEDSKLEADTILYDQNNQTIDARGNVRIYRGDQLTTGSAFKFNVDSDEYLITHPDTSIGGATVIARSGHGTQSGLSFKDGEVTLPEPIHLANGAMWGPLSAVEDVAEKSQHPDAFLPNKASWKFKARKMVYERYKDSGNMTVFGGKVMFGKFGVPVPKFTATVGKDQNNVVFPITPTIGNQMNIGGISVGPQFNFALPRGASWSVAPLLQIGGRQLDGTSTNSGKLGAGAKIGFQTGRLSGHLAYGSVSNLVVADLKGQVTKNMKFQSGINRFMDDGLFGMRRARFLAELVHIKGTNRVPFLQSVMFRSSAGLAQDNPSLLNLTPQFAELFNQGVDPGMAAGLRIQEQISVVTEPLVAVGNDQYGARTFIYGGAAGKGYSSGDALLMAQAGPILDVFLKPARMRIGYTQSGVRGQSPFVFDQFIQGSKSVSWSGDIRVSKFLTVGASVGYNLDNKLMYQRSFTAAVGPQDMKVLFSYDTIRRNNRYGFDLLFGQPIPFKKLVMKGAPDYGQLGGI